jgi:DnaJ family protein A protein 3
VRGWHANSADAQIPAGTSSHARLMLKGKGIKKRDSYGYGDHYFHIHINVPK